MTTVEFCRRFSLSAFAGTAPLSSLCATLVSNPAGSLGLRSTAAELAEIAGAGRKGLSYWEFHAAVPPAPAYLAGQPSAPPLAWHNGGQIDWIVTYVAVLGFDGGTPILLWFEARDPALVVAPDDTLLIPDGVHWGLTNP